MSEKHDDRAKTFTEELDLARGQLIGRIKELIAEGNVRRLRVRTADGDVFLEIPLTAGVVAGSIVTLALPWLAALGALAAIAARVKLEVVRETKEEEKTPPKQDKKAA